VPSPAPCNDADFEARFRLALENGELPPDADPSALAILASATLHAIAIRARAGVRRAEPSNTRVRRSHERTSPTTR
jgi:hypothetical protein